MTNVNGNRKKEQIVKGKGWRLGSRTRLGMRKTKEFITKKKIKHGAQFSKYAGPTVGMFKKTGAGALGVGKFALKRGALGFPGLIATTAGLGFKRAVRKSSRSLKFSPYNQFDKKARKRI